MERLTVRDSRQHAWYNNDGVLIRGANGIFRQKKDMTAHYIHDRFVALDKVMDHLASYEDTGLEPEEVTQIKLALEGKLLAEIKEFDGIPADRVIELLQAEKDGRLVILPDAKYTDADGEKALQKAMWTCGNTNNQVTRYTADAIAEKLCREAMDKNPPLTLEELREMDGEPVWVCEPNGTNGVWGLVDLEYQMVRLHGGGLAIWENNDKSWLAYRRKPE